MKKNSLLFFFFLPSLIFAQVKPVEIILQRLYETEKNLTSAKFTLYQEERLRDGKMSVSERLVKLRENPKQIYFYSVIPDPGTEILWKKGWNNDKMMVSPHGFPFATFNMRIDNSLARKDSHHVLTDIGFTYVTELIKYYLKKNGSRFYELAAIKDTVVWNNHTCYVLEFDFKNYAITKYTVLKNENVSRIAIKLHLNYYSILILNSSIKDLDDVREGQVINVPNAYAKKIVFYMDKTTGLPLRQFIYDQNGLYEKYEIKSFILNPVFDSNEFSPDYKGYKF